MNKHKFIACALTCHGQARHCEICGTDPLNDLHLCDSHVDLVAYGTYTVRCRLEYLHDGDTHEVIVGRLQDGSPITVVWRYL